MTRLLHAFAALLLAVATASAAAPVVSDGWALTDALGRKARGYADAGPLRADRYVGIFYWTWHQGADSLGGSENTAVEVRNISEVVAACPEAMTDYDHPAWGAPGHRPGVFYWDEPLLGYYQTTDPWVLRKHAELLADAGIDCVFFDCTNGNMLWKSSLWTLLATWQQALRDGVAAPKVAFMLPFWPSDDSRCALIDLYESLYAKGLYRDLWFLWEGKPLVMAYPDNLATTGREGAIRDFFTFRPGQPDYVSGPQPGAQQWGWLEVAPTSGYCPDSLGRPEQCTVGVAQNARDLSGGHCCAFSLPGTYGRSYSRQRGFDPRPDGYLYGWNFQEQWDRAVEVLQPRMVFVTGWNEWTSGMWTAADGWSDPLSFVDQYDRDHSRDIEPTAGWGELGDVYYQQLVDNVRRFKGMSPPVVASPPRTIALGNPSDWEDVRPRYVAYRGNTRHRDHPGRYNRHYVDNSGRNDIVEAQVAHDSLFVYFRVATADPLTPATDPNWMMLFIDIDRDHATGWVGYDYVVNRTSPAEGRARLERCSGPEWLWTAAGDARYVASGNVLEIAIPKSALGVGSKVDFEFKWADNVQRPGSVMDFYVSGDAAPSGRFNYVYTSPPVKMAQQMLH